MVALLAAVLPSAPTAVWAAELGQIIVNDPSGSIQKVLNPGDNITHAGNGAALDVAKVGNSVTADQVTIKASGGAVAVQASDGGRVELSNSTIQNLGAGLRQNAHAVLATGNGSVVTATNTNIDAAGSYSHGVFANNGGRIELSGGEVKAAGVGSAAISVEGVGSSVVAKNLTVQGDAHGVYVRQGKLEMEDAQIMSINSGVTMYGSASNVALSNTDINAGNVMGVRVEGGRFVMGGGSITANGSVLRLGQGAFASLEDVELVANGGTLYGIDINGSNATVELDSVSLSVRGHEMSNGVWLPSTGTSLKAKDFSFDVSRVGVDNRAGRVSLENGTITTHERNGYGLYVSREYGSSANINANNVQIETFGASAAGALARLSGAEIRLQDSTVTTHGEGAYGLYATGSNAKMIGHNTTVTTYGDNASGVTMSNSAPVTLDSTHFDIHGHEARGIWSYVTAAGINNAVSLTNGSSISTQDGAALLTSGGNHAITLDNAKIVARAGGVEEEGTLLHSRAITVTSGGVSTVIETGQVTLNASQASLTGNVLMDSGVADISLKNSSVMTGALIEQGNGRINSLAVDDSSAWNVRGNSSLDHLSNTGTVAFVAPGAGGNFKTLTVKDYVGGGTLVMNTRLGDDTSPTDKLIIDGGTTTGTTALRVLNAGGEGGQTTYGIALVETINGGTTTVDAFRLDAGSTAYRSSSDTLALNGYDYSLLRGGNGGIEDDWYLTSDYTPPVDPPPVKPDPPLDPKPPVEPPVEPPVTPPVLPPVGPGFKNVSPESGAYMGNQLAVSRLFMHTLHDRSSTGSDAVSVGDGRRMWARAKGRHDSGLRMAEGDVRIKTDSAMVQLGGDVLRSPLGKDGAAYAGVMAGYGDAQTYSTSTIRAPETGDVSNIRARGKVSGYSVGVYGTFYQNDSTRLGAYGDVWVQYGQYSNRINSELGSASYRSKLWSVSVESGYAFQPFSAESVLGDLVVEPNVQLMYSRYDAKDAALQGTSMSSGKESNWNARLGVRLYPMVQAGSKQAGVRPFIEANWLYSGDTLSVQMGSNTLYAQPSRNALELKLGVEGRLSPQVDVSGHLFGQAGQHSQRGYGGMLNVGYRW